MNDSNNSQGGCQPASPQTKSQSAWASSAKSRTRSTAKFTSGRQSRRWAEELPSTSAKVTKADPASTRLSQNTAGKILRRKLLKLSAKMKGRPAHNKGVKHTDESRARMSAKHKAAGIKPPSSKGKKHTPEEIAKMSAGQKVAWACRKKKAVENGGNK